METATAPTLGIDILLKIYSTMKTGILFKTFKALMLWINLQELYFLFRTFYLTSVTGLFIYLRDDVIVVYSYTPGAMWTSRNICQEYCYNLHLFVIYFFKFTGFELLLSWRGLGRGKVRFQLKHTFRHLFIGFIHYYRKSEKNQDNEIYLNTTTEINYYKYKSTKIYLYVLRQSYNLVKFHSMIHSARWYFEVVYKSSLQLTVSVIRGSFFRASLHEGGDPR